MSAHGYWDTMSTSEELFQAYVFNSERCFQALNVKVEAYNRKQDELDLEFNATFRSLCSQDDDDQRLDDYWFLHLVDTTCARLDDERTCLDTDKSWMSDAIISCLVLSETPHVPTKFSSSLDLLGELAYTEIRAWLDEIRDAHPVGVHNPRREYAEILDLLAETHEDLHRQDEIQVRLAQMPRTHRAYAEILNWLGQRSESTRRIVMIQDYLEKFHRDHPGTKEIRTFIVDRSKVYHSRHERLDAFIGSHVEEYIRCRNEIDDVVDNFLQVLASDKARRSTCLSSLHHVQLAKIDRDMSTNASYWYLCIEDRYENLLTYVDNYVSIADEAYHARLTTALFHSRIVDVLRADIVLQSRHVKVLRHWSPTEIV